MAQMRYMPASHVTACVRNKFAVGDRLQIIHPSGNQELVAEQMFNKKGENIQEASGSGYFVRLPIAAKYLSNAMVAKYL